MPKPLVRRRLLCAVIVLGVGIIGLFAPSTPVQAHGGGLDAYGCHRDRKAGTYHCHRGPCAGKRYSEQADMLRDQCNKDRTSQ